MIKSRNIHPDAEFGQETLKLDTTGGASLAGVRIDGWVAPWPGKIVRVRHYCATLTDGDDSARVDLHKNAASILTAAIDPSAADTTVTPVLGADVEFNEGDVLKSVVTTGVGDAIAGAFSVTVRPYLGYAERVAERNSGESVTP